MRRRIRALVLGVAAALIGSLTPALAQETTYREALSRAPEANTECDRDRHADHAHGEHCDPAVPDDAESAPEEPSEHAGHRGMGHDMPVSEDMHGMDHSAMHEDLPPDAAPREPIPAFTQADWAAAFPDVGGHAVHDTAVHSFWLIDRLEGWGADEGTGLGWELTNWTGTDLTRVWLRSEGEHVDGTMESANLEVLYGRAVARWWDLVAGIRHDFGEGPSQTFAAIGIQGLAPQRFELDATAYFGQSGQTAAQLEAEYDILFTNRLILQWQAAAEFYGQDDSRRGIGSGLSTVEVGLRLRYEFRREFAPYIGVAWERAYGGTADHRTLLGDDVDDTRLVAGVRIWF